VGSSSLKREILGIALLLFSVFLAGAFGALALAQARAPVSVEASVGVVGRILASPLVWFFGWPAAILIPLVPAVHALRLFGRLASDTDRSWMIFFAGVVVLLPVALALSIAPPPPGLPSLGAGLWGEFVASWWRGWFGSFGAWIVVALAGSVLMAATLAWNPVRALIGHRPLAAAAVVVADAPEVPAKRRRKRDAEADASDPSAAGGELGGN